MNKVVEFPKSKIVREIPPNIEEVEKAKEKGLTNFADGIVDDLIGNIYVEFENYGLDTESEAFDKDFSFAMDGVRATVYRILGLQHHLHEFLDKNVTMKKLEDIRMELNNEKPPIEVMVDETDIMNDKEED